MMRRARQGFTLVEMVATIVVLSVIGSVASTILLGAADGYVGASTRAQLHAELSIAMDRMVRELRNVQLDDSASDVAPDIDDVTASSIDWDDNNELNLTGSNVLLVKDGTASAILASDVTAFVVQTYDEDNSALATSLTGAACDDIRRVEIEITAERAGVTEHLRTRVFLRSTMSGAESP